LENTHQIVSYCKKHGSEIIGEIPYESKVVEALVNRKTIMDYPCNEVQEIVYRMWEKVEKFIISS
jgi:MinD superfamily P-loop ATPase